jgi:hypothetical protein
MADPRPPPVCALNWAAGNLATGARTFSDCLYAATLVAHDLLEDALVDTFGGHIAPQSQMQSVEEGYDEADEASFAQCGWPHHRRVSTRFRFFGRITESYAVCLPRGSFERIGGSDERFTSPGGGLAHLGIFRRYVCRDRDG